MGVKGVVRGLAGRLAQRVGQHDLFEKEGERAPSPALPPREPPSSDSSETESTPQSSKSSGEILAVDLSGLGPALGPGGGLRIVNHWATWCTGCVEELPELRRLREEVGEEVKFFGISWNRFQAAGGIGECRKEISETMAQHGLSWPTLLLQDGVAPEALFEALEMSCQTVPQTWLVDDQGRRIECIDHVLGSADTESLIARVKALR